jgi:hypothetical protein
MFMTSNGLAPIILDQSAQGGPSLDAPTDEPSDGTAPAVEDEDVEKTLAALIAAGDQDKLATYLRKINPEEQSS